jgi:hypothetical protein
MKILKAPNGHTDHSYSILLKYLRVSFRSHKATIWDILHFEVFILFLLYFRKLSNLKLLNVPSIDVISANPNLDLLNLALNIDFGTILIGGNFEIISKKILTEIPVTSSGEFM